MAVRQLACAMMMVATWLASAAAVPNVIVLLMDDLGYGDLPSYGNRLAQAPNIEALFSAGTRFTQWYSASPVCSPSRAALLTGRLPVRYGLAGATWAGGVLGANAEGGLPANETTLAQLLQANGYTTMHIGKWHLGQRDPYLPTRRGFDAYYGIPFSNDMAPTRLRPDPNPNGCTALPLLANETIIEQPVELNTITSRYTVEAIRFLTSAATVQRPFFLHMGYHDVHIPHACTEFCNASRLGPFGDALLEADDSIRRIVRAVADAGVTNNTLIYFVSDNGPWLITGDDSGSAGPLRGGKGTTWEGGIRVPAGVVWPGQVPAGRVWDQPVNSMDIFTTTLAMAGIAPPSDRAVDGKDQSAVFRGVPDAVSPWQTMFHYRGTPQSEPTERPGLWAVLHGPYKAHFASTRFQYWVPRFHDPPLLFNLADDIGEATELDPASYPDVLAEIDQAVRDHQASFVAPPSDSAGSPEFCLCCDPASQDRYPEYPPCTCNPENW